MKKLIYLFIVMILMSCASQQGGYNYSKHRRSGKKMHNATYRTNKRNYNQLTHKCSPKRKNYRR